MTNERDAEEPKNTTKQVKAAARAARLKAQLRQNLHKRKAQSRVRGTGKQDGGPVSEG